MEVSGSGKSTVGASLVQSVECSFLDADDFHRAANVEKVAALVRPADAIVVDARLQFQDVAEQIAIVARQGATQIDPLEIVRIPFSSI